MRRRQFIATLGAMGALPFAARAEQPAMLVVGFLGAGSPRYDSFRVDAVRSALTESGYVEGRNVAFEYRWAEDRYERLPTLASELASREVDVIVAIGGSASALAAKSATKSIPIVFAIGGDPAEVGLVASFNRPGGNVTGITFLTNVLVEKHFEILHEMVSNIPLIGYLLNPSNGNVEADTKNVLAAAERIDQKILLVKARTESELETAQATLQRQHIGAFLVAGDPFFFGRRDKIVEIAAHLKTPAIYPLSEYAKAGGLVSYGASLAKGFQIVGGYVARILKGEKPADLPVQQSTKVEFVINLKTAEALGLAVPPSLLGRADEVIE